MAGVAVAAFVPAELCPDHFVAAGTLTQVELLARDLGHGRLPLVACPAQHAVTTPGRFSVAGRAATRGQPGWRACTSAGSERSPHRRGAAPAAPERRILLADIHGYRRAAQVAGAHSRRA